MQLQSELTHLAARELPAWTKGLRLAAMILAACATLLALGDAARAQAPPNAPAREAEMQQYPRPPPLLTPAERRLQLEQQRRLVIELERTARDRAGNDQALYTALIREGLARIDRLLAAPPSAGELRSGPPRRSGPAALDLNTLKGEIQARDRTPVGQKALQDLGNGFQTRVRNGTSVPEGTMLDAVALRDLAIGGGCSGVRVGPRAVLTAAHCFCARQGGARLPMTGDVVFGSFDNNPRRFPIERGHFLSDYLQTSDYCAAKAARSPAAQGLDLVVVFFSGEAPGRPATIMHSVSDYFLVDRQGARPARLIVAGFGFTDSNDPGSGEKRAAWVDFHSRLCLGSGECAAGRELALRDGNRGSDTCPGDSGGPAYLRHTDGNWYLSAITSRALGNRSDCGEGGVYTLVTRRIVRWLCVLGAQPSLSGVAAPCSL